MERDFISEFEFEYLARTEVVLEKYFDLCKTYMLQLNKRTLDDMFSELKENMDFLKKKFPNKFLNGTSIEKICSEFKKEKIYKDADINNETIKILIMEMYSSLSPLRKLLYNY